MFHLFPMGADNPDTASSRVWDTPRHGLGSRAVSVKEKNSLQCPSLRMEWLCAARSCSLGQSTCSMTTRSCVFQLGFFSRLSLCLSASSSLFSISVFPHPATSGPCSHKPFFVSLSGRKGATLCCRGFSTTVFPGLLFTDVISLRPLHFPGQ